MKYHTLGSSKLKGSEICFGCAGIGGYDYGPVDDRTSINALRKAAEIGVNFFDTADVYGFGRSEELLKKAFGKRLSELVIATKFGVNWSKTGVTSKNISPPHIQKAIEASLSRLNIDSLKLYQIHWPDNKTRWEDCIEKLESLKSEGKIQHYGACNVYEEDLNLCQKYGKLNTLQIPFSLVERSNRNLLKQCTEHHAISTMAYNVLGNGLLSGKYNKDSTFSGTDLRTRVELFKGENLGNGLKYLDKIRAIAEKYDSKCVEIALAWTLAQPEVTFAIVGTKTKSQIMQSVASTKLQLTDSDIAYLSAPIN